MQGLRRLGPIVILVTIASTVFMASFIRTSTHPKPDGTKEPDEKYKSKLVSSKWVKPRNSTINDATIPVIRNLSHSATHTDDMTLIVPNIVHYCWYTQAPLPMRFIDFMGFMSAYKVLRPDAIYFHLDHEPLGPYWKAIKNLDRVKINQTDWPDSILGRKVKKPHYYTSGSNLCRTTQILHHGGIYLDMDVLVLNSFNPLRNYSCTMGLESPKRICGGIIIGARNTPFMQLWAQSYLDDYREQTWAYNTGLKPLELSQNFPGILHIENDTLHRPNIHEVKKMWGTETWNWHHNYAVHTWFNDGIRHYRKQFNDTSYSLDSVEDLQMMKNCTIKHLINMIIDL